jgi:hypothetical protein
MKPENEFEGLLLSCPKCDWEPTIELFYHLSLSVYLNNNKLPKIQCHFFNCTYSGTLLEWLHLWKDF